MCDTIRYKNIKDTQNFSANPEDTEPIQNEITTINIIEPVVEKKIKHLHIFLLSLVSLLVFLYLKH